MIKDFQQLYRKMEFIIIGGECGEEIIRTPKPTNFESFVEIYAEYFKTTHKAINFEEQNSALIPILLPDKYLNEFSEQNLISSGECKFEMQFFPKFLYSLKLCNIEPKN